MTTFHTERGEVIIWVQGIENSLTPRMGRDGKQIFVDIQK